MSILDPLRIDPRTRRVFQTELIQSGVFHCCVNCDFFKEDKCTKAEPPATPPPEVLVMSCDAWQIYLPF